ncbi:MAG: DinB family protein [Gemmatimonadaceae bacterium]
MESTSLAEVVMPPEAVLKHWQAHRRLTRRVIDAFPDDALFEHTIGGMRPFSELAAEMIGMAVPSLRGVVTRKWLASGKVDAPTKGDLLRLWDESTEEINELWPTIPPGRMQEVDVAFGQWEMPMYDLLFYVIDNEIHHRGQGYVYLRALGIEPPPFYERS